MQYFGKVYATRKTEEFWHYESVFFFIINVFIFSISFLTPIVYKTHDTYITSL